MSFVLGFSILTATNDEVGAGISLGTILLLTIGSGLLTRTDQSFETRIILCLGASGLWATGLWLFVSADPSLFVLAAAFAFGWNLLIAERPAAQPSQTLVTQTSEAPRVDAAPPALPLWLSEFIETYGMPTHLRTSRNYIEVCNEQHSSYVRLSLTSAAQQIPKEMGLRIHKEYYVIRAAVRRSTRDGGRHFLEIGNDIQLPVGRSFLAAVKAEGLIN